LANAPAAVTGLADGRLADVAPTLLELLGMEKPAAMTGSSLLITASETGAKDSGQALSAAQ